MKLLEKEQQLLEKLQQTIVQADINSKQAAKSACYGIEKTIEILHGRRRQLQDAWEERKKLLEQSVKSGNLDEEFKKGHDWIHKVGEPYLSKDVNGHSIKELESMLTSCVEFKKVFQSKREEVKRSIRQGQQLIYSGHFDAATIKYNISKLDQAFELFSQELDSREGLINQTLTFMKSSRKVESTLRKILTKLKQPKLNDYDKTKLRKESIETSSTILREGKILKNKIKNRKVEEILDMLKKQYELILNQTENQVAGEDPEIIAVNKDSDKSFNWLSNIGEDFLSNNKNMGTKRNQLQQFQVNHQQLFEELNNINKVILHMKNTLQNYPKKKKKIVYDLIDKIETMQNKSSTLSSRIKFRLLTVKLVLSFTDHTDEILKKLFLLEEELSSEEPHENINATTATLNRQKQEKEEIINSAEILQEEGQRIIEDIMMCSEETTLDRAAVKLKIGKDLKNIVQHTMQVEELWEQRESQLDTNKRSSSQFHEFEKEIRKVIGWVHDQNESFYPLIGDATHGLSTTQKELQERLTQFQSVAQYASDDIEHHILAAQNIAKGENSNDSQNVANKFKLVHQKFKTNLAKYEALLSMCSTFYIGVEKLVTCMNKSLQDYTSDFLPRDTYNAESKLNDHIASIKFVEDMLKYTIQNGEEVIQDIGPFQEESVLVKDGKRELNMKSLEINKNELEENLELLKHLQEISQISLLIEDHTRVLLRNNSKYGNSLVTAVTLCQELDLFQEQIKVTEQRFEQLRANTKNNFHASDDQSIKQRTTLIEKRLSGLNELMESYRSLLNYAVEFYQLCEQVETWLKDSNQFVKTTRSGAGRCTNEKDIRELLELTENFQFSGVEIQQARLNRLCNISLLLNNEEARIRAVHLKDVQVKVNSRLEQLKSDMEKQILKFQGKIKAADIELIDWDDGFDYFDFYGDRKLALPNNTSSLTPGVNLKGEQLLTLDENMNQVNSNQPKLLVSVKSNNSVPSDMQQRISPLVQSEMNQLKKEPAFGNIPAGRRSSDVEGKKPRNGNAVLFGPETLREISVKTDCDIESTAPSASPDDHGLTYTMKKTFTTTTKEVITHTKQEIKTELEVVHVDSEDELPKRLLALKKDTDQVGVSVTTMSSMVKQAEINEEQIANAKHSLQTANENICKGVEKSLFTQRLVSFVNAN